MTNHPVIFAKHHNGQCRKCSFSVFTAANAEVDQQQSQPGMLALPWGARSVGLNDWKLIYF